MVGVWWANKQLAPGFINGEDQGYAYAVVVLPPAASLQRTDEVCKKVEKLVEDVPGVASCTTVVGYNLISSVQNTYSGFFFITLKPWDERYAWATVRTQNARAIFKELNAKIGTLPECVGFAFPPPPIPGIGTAGGVTFVLQDRAGRDVDYLESNLTTFLAAAQKRPEIASLQSTFNANVPQRFVTVDKDRVLKQGVELSSVYQTIQTFMGGAFINYFNRFGRQWQVYLQAEGPFRAEGKNLGQFYVRNTAGEAVSLASLTSIKDTSGPEFTQRFNLYRSAQINAFAAGDHSSTEVMKALEETFKETMPPDMGFSYMGMSYQEQQAAQGVPPAAIFALSLLFVFLILAALYESWSLPFSVLLSLPIAVLGAFLALWSRTLENNAYAQIGLIMLIGLAAKNAILIVEFSRAELEKGQTLFDAALEGARLRLRPILMTSFAFILGCVPLLIALGAGAVSRRASSAPPSSVECSPPRSSASSSSPSASISSSRSPERNLPHRPRKLPSKKSSQSVPWVSIQLPISRINLIFPCLRLFTFPLYPLSFTANQKPKNYDLVILGGGPAGLVAANTATANHKTVAVIDCHRELGGAGINTGTVPSKTLRETALALSGLQSRNLYGVDLSLRREVTISDFLGREQNVRAVFNDTFKKRLASENADVFYGMASFIDPHTISVVPLPPVDGGPTSDSVLLHGESILIATGSSPVRPGLFFSSAGEVYDSDTILKLDRIPKTMASIGAGVIGSEYASTFAAARGPRSALSSTVAIMAPSVPRRRSFPLSRRRHGTYRHHLSLERDGAEMRNVAIRPGDAHLCVWKITDGRCGSRRSWPTKQHG